MPIDEDQYFSVSELNQFIKGVVNSAFPQTVWVCGEIQGFNRNKNKSHIFFELIEKDKESKEVKSRIGLVLFAGRKGYIQKVLTKADNVFELRDDIEVKFECKVDYYDPHGVMRLIVESIDPFYTVGKLALEKQQLIATLKKEGVLEKNKQLLLSEVPLRIGLITSDDSAAYNDFIDEIGRSGFHFEIYVRNTLMQGKKTEQDVCDGLDELGQVKNLDAIVITRGGGSLADLACFDSKLIAEKIARMPMPILTGIGHEINLSIADLAAHTYEKTPTAIAQFLIARVQVFLDRLNANEDRLKNMLMDLFAERKQYLKNLAMDLQQGTMRYLKEHQVHVIRMNEKLSDIPRRILKEKKNALVRLAGQLNQTSVRLLREEQRGLERFKDNIIRISENRILQDQRKIESFQKMVDFIHPVNTMKRGFSVMRNSAGKSIRTIEEVKNADILTTEVVNGFIQSEVKETQSKKE